MTLNLSALLYIVSTAHALLLWLATAVLSITMLRSVPRFGHPCPEHLLRCCITAIVCVSVLSFAAFVGVLSLRCDVISWAARAGFICWMFIVLHSARRAAPPEATATSFLIVFLLLGWASVVLQLTSNGNSSPHVALSATLLMDACVAVFHTMTLVFYVGLDWLLVNSITAVFPHARRLSAAHDATKSGVEEPEEMETLPYIDSQKGMNGSLHIDSLLQLSPEISVSSSLADMRRGGWRYFAIGIVRQRWGSTLARLALIRFLLDFGSILPAHLLRALVDNLTQEGSDQGSDRNKLRGHDSEVLSSVVYVVLIIACSLLCTFLRAHYNKRLQEIALYNKGLLTAELFHRALYQRRQFLSCKSQGDIMNYLSVDVDRVADVVKSLNDLWALPLQLAMVLYLLYVQVSFAFLAGVAFSAALVPVNVWLTKRIQKVQTDLMHENDKRVLRVTEIIRNITYIKMCGWSRLVQSWVNESRVQYLKHLKWLKYLDSFCVFFWAATPTIVSLFTFITFILMGGHLTPGKAVTALALFGSLIMPLNAYPWVINGVVEAYVSWQRLKPFLSPHQMSGSDCCYNAASFTRKRFETNKTNRDENFVLAAGEVQPLLDGRWFLVPPRESPCSVLGNTRGRHCEAGVEATLVDIAHCTVSYGTHETIGDKESSFTLRITAFKALRGQLTAIVGVSGSGKSTFLDALAGELDLRSDTAVARVFISRLSVAYVEQQPFLTSGTLRDNIVFGLPFEPARYEAVLAAVALTDDIRLHFAPCGDLSPVGDRGIRLSGGQRVRVALARALYANKGLYLFDDVFGCLDATVARHVVEHAILATVRSGGSVIIATHCQEIICQADAVYKCVDGQLVFVEQSLVTGSCQAVGAGSLKASCTRKERSIECANFAEEKLARVAGDAARGDEKAAGSMVSVGAVEQALDSPSSSPGADPHKALYGDTKLETTEHGALAWATVMCYINRVGCLLSIVITASIAAMQASRNLSDQYLVGWSRSENRDASAFVQTLALLSAVNSVLALTRGFSFAFGGLRAAERFHEELLNHILSATFTFFSSTQPGCIINRLSSDTYTIDNSLPFIANIFLAQSFLLLGSVIVVVVNSSIFLVLTLMPLAFLYYCIQLPYRCASRELRRVEEAARAPLLDNMRDALDGGVVIRSLGGQALETHLRRAHNSVDLLLRVQFNSCLLSAWFAIRLELVGLLLMLIIGILAVCSHGSTRAPFMGLALAYVQPLTSYVSGLLSAFATTETHLISVERVRQYFSLASEGTNKREVWLSPLVRWPTLGRVNFVDVSMRYDPNGARVLQGLSFSVEAGERVAIVGRTGAGKSSIFCALLRLCEIEQGSIMIDGEDIRQFPLDQLRTRLGVLPQQPFVFHGTLRKNIDPFDLHDDDDVRAAMACVKLGSLDLDFNISDSNSMSCSQRHQVALARVILQRSPLLLLDEPSSQSSDDAEEALWESLSDHLGGTTVLCITHKLAHIDFFDRVLVVDGGRVVNSGTPTQLRSARVWPFLTGYDTTVQLD